MNLIDVKNKTILSRIYLFKVNYGYTRKMRKLWAGPNIVLVFPLLNLYK